MNRISPLVIALGIVYLFFIQAAGILALRHRAGMLARSVVRDTQGERIGLSTRAGGGRGR